MVLKYFVREWTIAILFLLTSLRSDSLPIQSVLNAAARLIARLPKFSHIPSLIINQLHWLSLSVPIQLKMLVLVLKSKLGVSRKYLRDHIGSLYLQLRLDHDRYFNRQISLD